MIFSGSGTGASSSTSASGEPIAGGPLELGEPAGGEQLAHALAAAAERVPGVDHAALAQDPRPRPRLGRVADQSHGRGGYP